jgi:hypothetical protein
MPAQEQFRPESILVGTGHPKCVLSSIQASPKKGIFNKLVNFLGGTLKKPQKEALIRSTKGLD